MVKVAKLSLKYFGNPLATVTDADPKVVNIFYKTLLYNVQLLETLGKIERVNGMTRRRC